MGNEIYRRYDDHQEYIVKKGKLQIYEDIIVY